jgi:hypothetical protein
MSYTMPEGSTLETCSFKRTEESESEYGFSMNDGEKVYTLLGKLVEEVYDLERSAVEAPEGKMFKISYIPEVVSILGNESQEEGSILGTISRPKEYAGKNVNKMDLFHNTTSVKELEVDTTFPGYEKGMKNSSPDTKHGSDMATGDSW